MKKHFIIIAFLLLASHGYAQKTLDELLNQYNTRSIPYISVEELRMLQLNSNITILDTREEAEYFVSHIDGAIFSGFNTFSSEHISEVIKDKDAPIIVYCSLGIRSEIIGEKLKKAGYSNVQNLYGGIFEWKNKEFPILNRQNKHTDSVHAFSKPWSKWLYKGIKVYLGEEE